MIIAAPDMPPLGPTGGKPSPLVLMFGGCKGTWQTRFALSLDKVAQCVVRTNSMGIMRRMQAETYLDAADVIVIWCGAGKDSLYGDEWTQIGFMIGRYHDKLVCGVSPKLDHPMAEGLMHWILDAGLSCHPNLETTISAAQERCRELRRKHGARN